MGFTLPLEKWLRKDEILNYMNPIMRVDSNIVNSSAMRNHWKKFLNNESGTSFAKIWSLYSLQCFDQRNK